MWRNFTDKQEVDKQRKHQSINREVLLSLAFFFQARIFEVIYIQIIKRNMDIVNGNKMSSKRGGWGRQVWALSIEG